MSALTDVAAKDLSHGRQGLLPKRWSVEFSPPLRGGVAARSRKSREASFGSRRRGGVQPQQNSAEFDHHPVRSVKEASRCLIEVAATPPRRGGENCGPRRFGQQVLAPVAALIGCASRDILDTKAQIHSCP